MSNKPIEKEFVLKVATYYPEHIDSKIQSLVDEGIRGNNVTWKLVSKKEYDRLRDHPIIYELSGNHIESNFYDSLENLIDSLKLYFTENNIPIVTVGTFIDGYVSQVDIEVVYLTEGHINNKLTILMYNVSGDNKKISIKRKSLNGIAIINKQKEE